MEFAGPAPLGPFATLAAEMPLRKVNDVKQVEPGTQSGNTAPDTGRDRDNGPEAAAARDITMLRREIERRDLPTGPPPTFEVSQLEFDADIQHVIARVEAARSQAREADALKLSAETEERLAEAEMARLTEAATGAVQDTEPGAAQMQAQGSEMTTVSTRPTPKLDAQV